MVSQTFQCPSCGASLDYSGGDDSVVRCRYCFTTVVVPENLRRGDLSSQAFTASLQAGPNQILQPEQLAKIRELAGLVRQGNKIEAIKIYREVFATGLKESKDAIDRLAEGKAIAITYAGQPLASNSGMEAEIRQFLEKGQKVEAVRRYRQVYNLGLKASKDAVDLFETSGYLPTPSAPAWSETGQDLAQALGHADDLLAVIQLAQSGDSDAAVARYRQAFGASPEDARKAVQQIAAETSAGASPSFVQTSYVAISPEKAAKIAAGATASLVGGVSCFGVLLTAVILLAVLVPLFFAFTSSGGPLEGAWARLNPLAFARLTLAFGEKGSGAGLFDDPRSIAVDPSGNVYVANYADGRVQKFDPSGKLQLLWNVGANQYVNSIAADRAGNVFMVYRGQIWKYDGAAGKLVGQIEHPFGRSFEAVAAAADGGLVAAVNSEDVLRFDSDLQVVFSLADAATSLSGKPENVEDVAVDGVGNIYLLAGHTSSVIKYSPEGRLLARFGSQGDEPGQLRAPSAIAVDGQGRIYVSDFKDVQVFANDGRYLNRFNVQGFAFGMTFDQDGALWVVSNLPRVFRYQIAGR